MKPVMMMKFVPEEPEEKIAAQKQLSDILIEK